MKPFLPPVLTLCAILAFSVWNCLAMETRTERWSSCLQESSSLALREDWPAAREALEESYQDWSRYRSCLRVVSNHDILDSADAMYRRAGAFARLEESSEFQAETAGLLAQLQLLAEQERFTWANIL